MMSFLEGIKFSIITDRDGDFSRAFGVLKLKDGQNVKDHKESKKTNTKARGKAGDEEKMKK